MKKLLAVAALLSLLGVLADSMRMLEFGESEISYLGYDRNEYPEMRD